MRRLIYSVAASLDGYIAGTRGEFDWIPMDPDIDFGELMGRFDTVVMGRHSYEVVRQTDFSLGELKCYVVSRTLRPEDHPQVTILSENIEPTLRSLREQPGKDIWLFGGGQLFQRLLNAHLVDRVEVAIAPVLLGGGIPLLPAPTATAKLRLLHQRLYPKTGILLVEYAVE